MKRRVPGLPKRPQFAADEIPDGIFLVRVDGAQFRWHPASRSMSSDSPYSNPRTWRAAHCRPPLLHAKAMWKLGWFLRDFLYDPEFCPRTSRREGFARTPRRGQDQPHRRQRYFPDQPRRLRPSQPMGGTVRGFLIARTPDPRRPDDLLLHPDQPVPQLPAPLPASLPRRLAGEGHARRHALRPSIRTGPGRLFRREDPELCCFANGLLQGQGPDYSTATTPGTGCCSKASSCSSASLRTTAFASASPSRISRLSSLGALPQGNDFVAYVDAIGELDGTPCVLEWKTTSSRYPEEPAGILTGSATGLLLLDDRNRRSRPDRFRAQAAGRSPVPPGHDHRGTAPGIRNWSKTQSDGSSPGCSCRIAASASRRIPAQPAPSSGSASTSRTWSKPLWCASPESTLVCLTNLIY